MKILAQENMKHKITELLRTKSFKEVQPITSSCSPDKITRSEIQELLSSQGLPNSRRERLNRLDQEVILTKRINHSIQLTNQNMFQTYNLVLIRDSNMMIRKKRCQVLDNTTIKTNGIKEHTISNS